MRILFYMGHQGFSYNLVQYYCSMHRNDEAYLIVDDFQARYTKNHNYNIFFKKVIHNHVDNELLSKKINDGLIESLCNHYDILLLDNDIILNGIDKIYLQSDVCNSFGVYLSIKGVQYSIFESSPGDSMAKGRYEADANIRSADYLSLQKKYGVLCGEGHDIIRWGANGFDYLKCVDSFDEQLKNKIFACFNVNVARIKNYKQIIIANSSGFTSADAHNVDEIELLYKTLIDYYTDEFKNVVIKAHPAANPNYLSKFPSHMLDSEPYNIEILNLMNQDCKYVFYTIQSSSVNKIRNFDTVSCGIGFLKNYKLFYKIYASCDFLKNNGYTSIYLNFNVCSVFLKSLETLFNIKFCKNLKNADVAVSENYISDFPEVLYFKKNDNSFANTLCLSCMDHQDFSCNCIEKLYFVSDTMHDCHFISVKHLKYLRKTYLLGLSRQNIANMDSASKSLAIWKAKVNLCEKNYNSHDVLLILSKIGYSEELKNLLFKTNNVRFINSFLSIAGFVNFNLERDMYLKLSRLDENFIINYCDVLNYSKNESDINKLIDVCMNHLDNPDCMGLLGRVYSRYKTLSDFQKADHYYSCACDVKPAWSSEYIIFMRRYINLLLNGELKK